jgi:amino acid adenylation domain-containing protein
MNSPQAYAEVEPRAMRNGERAGIPCSQSQKRFWFEARLDPHNPALNVAVRWRLEGKVVHAHLEEAWRLIIARHQTLRTAFATIGGEPRQVVEPEIAFHIPVVDLTGMSDEAAAAEAERLASLEAKKIFDIAQAPLIRVTHLRVRSDVSMLLVSAHHAVCDGWSVGILAAEMGEICAALHDGRAPVLPELSATYADYAAQEREWLVAESGSYREELAQRWRCFEQFEILPDKARPPIQTSNGEIASELLDRGLTGALTELARKNHCTLFMVAYAALLALLHRYSGETDITIGTQFAGRDEVEFEHLVGTFVNTVSLRTDVGGDPTFSDLLERARDTVTDAYELRYVPLEELIEIVNPKRDLSRNALFSINLVFQRSFIKNETYGSFRLIDLPSRSAGPICDLNFFMVERPEGWRASCEFNTDLYRRETVDRMLRRWIMLMRSISRDPSCPVSALPMLDAHERRQVLEAFNATEVEYPLDQLIHQLFETQVRKNPNAEAVVYEAESLSYAELDRRANQLANYLRTLGVGPERLVAICLERSFEMVVGLLGILKSGGAYIPVDPAYPADRIAYMLADAAPEVVLTHERLREVLPRTQAPVVSLDGDWDLISRNGDAAPATNGLTSRNLAYVIYTSGSTGQPKGVMNEHRAVTNRLLWMQQAYRLTTDDVVLQKTTFSFDVSVWEFFWPLLSGAKLVLARPEGHMDPAYLAAVIRRHGVTTTHFVPSMLQAFLDHTDAGAFSSLTRVICSGEALPRPLTSRFFAQLPSTALYNLYGPTEAAVDVTAWTVEPDRDEASVPIGRPIANARIYILDPRGNPVPIGVCGELHIGGVPVARGYLNRPALTAERFVPDRFAVDPGARIYKTGDIARYRSDGAIEYLGRNDSQVKIRGFRIELGEVEARLNEHAGIGQAVVVAREDRSGDKRLIAYYTPAHGFEGDAPSLSQQLRSYLSARLPEYMIPSSFVPLPAMPLTPNGKLDRKSLPAPAGYDPSVTSAVEPPLGEVERAIAQIWCEVLNLKHVSRQDDFFMLGGHSLLAVRFISRLQHIFGVDLQLRVLFENPTIAAIAARIKDVKPDDEGGAETPVITLNAGGSRPPFIYFHSDLFANGLYSRHLASALGPDQPLHIVAPHGTAGLPLLPTIEQMARDYQKLLRAVQPTGPYRLGGYCASGLVAYELARLLRAQGEVVERLVLLNSSPMPTRSIGVFDALIRRIGLNARLAPRVRDRLCYNLARLHAAVLMGPRVTFGFIGKTLSSFLSGRWRALPGGLERQPFEKRQGPLETENSFAHLVAAFTYHPRPHDGDGTLIWSDEEQTTFDDPTKGWGTVLRQVNVEVIGGGHVAAIHQRIDDLARLLKTVLGDQPR